MFGAENTAGAVFFDLKRGRGDGTAFTGGWREFFRNVEPALGGQRPHRCVRVVSLGGDALEASGAEEPVLPVE